jgi:hypothetical protein
MRALLIIDIQRDYFPGGAYPLAGPEEAAAASVSLGFPVVLKIRSPDIVHKSDIGGIALGLGDAAAVREAFDRFDRVLGILALRRAEDERPPVPVEEIEQLMQARRAARASRSASSRAVTRSSWDSVHTGYRGRTTSTTSTSPTWPPSRMPSTASSTPSPYPLCPAGRLWTIITS